METSSVSCRTKAWIASVRTTFGARSTWRSSTRLILRTVRVSIDVRGANTAPGLLFGGGEVSMKLA